LNKKVPNLEVEYEDLDIVEPELVATALFEGYDDEGRELSENMDPEDQSHEQQQNQSTYPDMGADEDLSDDGAKSLINTVNMMHEENFNEEDLIEIYEEAAFLHCEDLFTRCLDDFEKIRTFRLTVGNSIGFAMREHNRRNSLKKEEDQKKESLKATDPKIDGELNESISSSHSMVGNWTEEECADILKKEPNNA
jgi:hypothetical protein